MKSGRNARAAGTGRMSPWLVAPHPECNESDWDEEDNVQPPADAGSDAAREAEQTEDRYEAQKSLQCLPVRCSARPAGAGCRATKSDERAQDISVYRVGRNQGGRSSGLFVRRTNGLCGSLTHGTIQRHRDTCAGEHASRDSTQLWLCHNVRGPGSQPTSGASTRDQACASGRRACRHRRRARSPRS